MLPLAWLLGHVEATKGTTNCFTSYLAKTPLADCLKQFLIEFMPPWDRLNEESLEGGILGDTISVALEARQNFSWASDVSWPLFSNWVLPYASVNEARTSWRTLLKTRMSSLLDDADFRSLTRISDVVDKVNGQVWKLASPGVEIVFKAQQTPKIYDPMSTIGFGFASCTGISLLLVDSLRVAGVPARIVGTPAWNGQVENGNHNWVEVWLGEEQGWTFLEGAPAGGGSLFEPCSHWFCTPAKMEQTKVYVPQWERVTNDTIYPMAWDFANKDIPGQNRTSYYHEACKPCGQQNALLL